MQREQPGGVAGTATGEDEDQVKVASDTTTMSVEEVMMVYFSWGRVMLKNCWNPSGTVDLRGLVERGGDLAHAGLGRCSVWNGTNCQAIAKTTTNSTRSESPSQSWAEERQAEPAPAPKLGSRRALNAMATAAEDSSSGTK